MSDREQHDAREWVDRDGTAWRVTYEAAVERPDTPSRVVFRSEVYAFRVDAPERTLEELQEHELHGFLDRHRDPRLTEHGTARLWTDPRSGVEWEVHTDAGELVFRRGTEAVRTRWGDARPPPTGMDDDQLVDALDAAQAGG